MKILSAAFLLHNVPLTTASPSLAKMLRTFGTIDRARAVGAQGQAGDHHETPKRPQDQEVVAPVVRCR